MPHDPIYAELQKRNPALSGGASARISAKPQPSSARNILEMLTGYPADPSQEMGPLDAIGLMGSIVGVRGPNRRLLGRAITHDAPAPVNEALRPLSGSVDEVMKLIQAHRPSFADQAVQAPEGFLTAPPAVQELVQTLSVPPPKTDPLLMFAGEKMSSRPPKVMELAVPEGFKLGKHSNPTQKEREAFAMKRDPLVEQMARRYKVFDETQKSAPRSGPPISGTWKTRK